MKISKKVKLISFISLFSTISVAAMALSSVAWLSSVMEITPSQQVPSHILTSYFDSRDSEHPCDGTQSNPYVITRPVHYYNLVYLQNSNYGFDENTYFEFGKSFTNDGPKLFYNYGDDGVIITTPGNEYSTSLNLNFYKDDYSLSPIGSASYPFKSKIEGNNLTIDKIHIKGEGKSDVGIFGYVFAETNGDVRTGASINNIYFNNVTINVDGSNSQELLSHNLHTGKVSVGYIAGHVCDEHCFTNAYVNNVKMLNVSANNKNLISNYGLIGFTEVESQKSSSIIDSYHKTYKSDKVHDYFEDEYASISGNSVITRDTEYEDSGILSDAMSSNSGNYSIKSASTSANGNTYSLGKTGVGQGDTSYEVRYLDGDSGVWANYKTPLGGSGTTITSTSPDDQTSEGDYVYYDNTNNKWVYYTAHPGGGGSGKTYNCYTISFEKDGTTKYAYCDSNSRLAYSDTLPSSGSEDYLNYLFVFTQAMGGAGLSEISDNATTVSKIMAPKNGGYLYFASEPSSSIIIAEFDLYHATDFTITGRTLTSIAYGSEGTGHLIESSGLIKGKKTTASDTLLYVTITGSKTEEHHDEESGYYTKVTSVSGLDTGKKLLLVGTKNGTTYAIAGQNSNNRATASVELSASGDRIIGYANAKELTLGISGSYYTFLDPGTGYLYAASSSANQLKSQASVDANAEWSIRFNNNVPTIQAHGSNTRNYLRFNQNGGNNPLFACYSSDSQSTAEIWQKTVTGGGTYYSTDAIEKYIESGGGGQLTKKQYDTYILQIGGSLGDVEQFVISPSRVTWHFTNSLTTVDITPEVRYGWTRVTSATDLTDGDRYVMGYYENTGDSEIAKTFGPIEGNIGTALDNAVFANDGDNLDSFDSTTIEFELEVVDSEHYSFKNSANNKYLHFSGDKKLSFDDTKSHDSSYEFKITFEGTNVLIKGGIQNAEYNYKLQYNKSSPRFTIYTTDQAKFSLYKATPVADARYFGDEIATSRYDESFDYTYIDVLGDATFTSTDTLISANAASNVKSISYWDNQTSVDAGIGDYFFSTRHLCGGIAIYIKNTGCLDFGTLTLRCSNNVMPSFIKGFDLTGGESISFSEVSCLPSVSGGLSTYKLSLNPYNIKRISYCALDSGKEIISSYSKNGSQLLPAESVAMSDISTFVLFISNTNSSTLNIRDIDLEFEKMDITSAEFGKIGYRTATYTNNIFNDVETNKVPGDIMYVKFEILSSYSYFSMNISYDSNESRYTISFNCSSAMNVVLLNYDAEEQYITFNGDSSTYTESRHIIPISSSSGPFA